MNAQLHHLFTIAQKSERRIVGLMSGTSLDGLDMALCRITGSGPATSVTLERFMTVPYDDSFKDEVRAVFAKRQIDFEQLCLLNPFIGRLHGQLVLDALQSWQIAPADIDILASHGQTVYHAPRSQHRRNGFPNATLQIGDGDHVAATTGIITLSDFRQKHVAHGGEGAPLAVYGDYFMFSAGGHPAGGHPAGGHPAGGHPAGGHPAGGQNRMLLNMGGIANFTYLPASGDASRVFTTDTGPGNTLLDAYARTFLNRPYDENGAMARSGQVCADLLAALKVDPFFTAPFPKTTGPEVFSGGYVAAAQARSHTETIPPADLMATLVQFSADTIASAIMRVMQAGETYYVYMSGGGAHNPALTDAIRRNLPDCIFGNTTDLGIDGDAKEAVLFAVLANECLMGGTTSFGNRQGVPSITMGKISLP